MCALTSPGIAMQPRASISALPGVLVRHYAAPGPDGGPPDGWFDRLNVDIGFGDDHLIEGTLADVVASYGAFTEHQVLVCGSASMVRSTRDRLFEAGTPAEVIQFDPY